jgi:hypothetical protein
MSFCAFEREVLKGVFLGVFWKKVDGRDERGLATTSTDFWVLVDAELLVASKIDLANQIN